MFLVMWGGYGSWQNPHLLPEEVWKSFFLGVFFLRSQDGGPSHMGEQPELTGFLGQPAVWGLGVQVP